VGDSADGLPGEEKTLLGSFLNKRGVALVYRYKISLEKEAHKSNRMAQGQGLPK